MANSRLALHLLPAIAVSLLTAFIKQSGHCSLLLPEQFHCSTELLFYHRELSTEDTFYIDEYVDRPNRRSSLRLVDNERGLDLIYYNELYGKEEGPIERHFQQYDVNKMTCMNREIYGWHLAQMRKLAIAIFPMDQVTPKNVDIAIGSGGLLYAIESRLEELEYRGSKFDPSRLIYVDVYELSVAKPFAAGGAAYNSGKDLLVQVSTMVRNKSIFPGKEIVGKSLAQVAELTQYKLNLVSIKLCSVKASKLKRRLSTLKPYECQGDLLSGQEQDLIASINLIEDLKSDSLIGQPLEKAGQFDFDLNPFAQPAGLGCGLQKRSVEHGRRNTVKTFKAQSSQFSAEYFSMNGLEGLAYVAFDNGRQVLRHDRGGRKNIYDLRQARSYHVEQFRSVKSMFDQRQATNCVELNIDDDMQLVGESISVMSRLLGIDETDEANYLGTKTINDETFDVYELELEQDKNSPNSYNLPIVMESIDFVMPSLVGSSSSSSSSSSAAKKRLRYFMTYYVLEIPRQSATAAAAEDPIKIPRFVELWELREEWKSREPGEGPDRERLPINLVEFTQFSWSLNVQPAEEEASSTVVGDLSRLFSMDQCAQERSEQLLLTFAAIDHSKPAELIQANRQTIRESLHEQLASLLDIPRLNLLSLDFHFSPSQTGMWFIRAKIAELVRGISQDTLLGYLQFARSSQWLTAAALFKGENRHSLDQCRLDSLALNKATNTIVYCPGLTLCLLVDSEAVEQHGSSIVHEENKNDKIRSTDNADAVCELHQFTWRPVPLLARTTAPADGDGSSSSVLSRVFENKNRILSNNFKIDLEPLNEVDARKKPIKYQGFGHGVKVQLLDETIGRRYGGGAAASNSPLSGLRYLDASEEDQQETSRNSNYAYKLTTGLTAGGDSYFRQCHMACQMDEFCESFSVCKSMTGRNEGKNPNNSAQHPDCVLSTMRLTGDKISELADTIGAHDRKDPEISIEVSTSPDDTNSLIFKFKRDSACSLHPKDVLAQFKPTKSVNLPIDLDKSDRDLSTGGASVVSLEECAGISNEAALQDNSLEAQFVYCPLESLCLSSEQSVQDKQKSSSLAVPESVHKKVEKCFVYEKSHYQNFYDYTLFHKLSLQLSGSHALEDDFVQKIGRTIEGLSLEQCARDCNLQQSGCLAFDVCEFETNVTVCTLYSIRSPLAPTKSSKMGFLPQEERFYAAGSASGDLATLVENGRCAHFNLKLPYFQLRINHMLEGDSGLQRKKLNELEKKILEIDSKMGDSMMMSSILGSSPPGDQNNGESSKQQQQQQVKESSFSNSSIMVHLALIISSATLGALGYLYAGEAYAYTRDTVEYIRARRGQRFGGPRISQLNLPNNLIGADL